jgi:ribonucleoside-triphosphate reductase
MYFKTTYTEEFDDLYMHLKAKYPQKLFDLDGIGKQLDMSEFSKNFFASSVTADASIDANANVDDVSVIAYNTELPKPFFKINSYYVLWKELRRLYGLEVANNIVELQLTGGIYIHDFHGVGAGMPYCFNYSTYDIMTKGLPMVKKVKSLPPKHLYAFKSQLEQFTVIASNSTLGATGLADLLVVMSYYVNNILKSKTDAHFKFETEEDCWIYVKENIISFIYTINQPMRANQSPFTNISIYDEYFLDKLCDDYLFPDGSNPNKEIVKNLQKIYLDIMNDELRRTPLTFPVTTACFSIDSENNIKDEAFLRFIAEQNKEYGFINIYCGDSSTLSSCCRLRSEQKSEYFNSFGSGSSKIGSLGVCSINFPRLAIQFPNREDFLQQLVKMVEVCAKVNNAKRHIIEKRIKNGNEPLYTLGYMELSKQYSTVGVNGFNECIEILGEDILEENGQNLAIEILDTINLTNTKFQKQYNAPHNCEQVPAEGLSVKLADKDKLLGYQHDYDIYSNQFIPLVTNADMLDRIKLQGMFDKHFSGGAICHLNVDSKIEKTEDIMDLIRITAKMGVVYHAINYVLEECEDGHMSVGNGEVCSICGKPIINKYTRVVGFLTNVKNWNKTRREKDFPNRQFYGGVQV